MLYRWFTYIIYKNIILKFGSWNHRYYTVHKSIKMNKFFFYIFVYYIENYRCTYRYKSLTWFFVETKNINLVGDSIKFPPKVMKRSLGYGWNSKELLRGILNLRYMHWRKNKKKRRTIMLYKYFLFNSWLPTQTLACILFCTATFMRWK